MATRSMPIVSWLPVSIAILTLVPTPSVAATSTGSLKPGALEVEQPAEAADLGVRAGPRGRAHQRLDQLDHAVAGVDIDAGLRVGQAVPLVVHAGCPTSESREPCNGSQTRVVRSALGKAPRAVYLPVWTDCRGLTFEYSESHYAGAHPAGARRGLGDRVEPDADRLPAVRRGGRQRRGRRLPRQALRHGERARRLSRSARRQGADRLDLRLARDRRRDAALARDPGGVARHADRRRRACSPGWSTSRSA